MRLKLLAWGAVILAGTAAFLLLHDWVREHRGSPGLVGRSLIGPADLSKAGIVIIETPDGQVTLERTTKGWVVQEQHRFAADVERMRALLRRLSRTTIAMRVPVSPERLADMSLLKKAENDWHLEAGRTASVLSVLHGPMEQHRGIYELLVGNLHPDGQGTFVRFPGARTVYLVPEPLTLDGRAGQWIDRRIFPPAAVAQLRRVSMRAPGRPPVRLARASAEAPWRRAAPDGPAAEGAVAELLAALAGLRIAVVSPRGAEPPAPGRAPVVELGLFDGTEMVLALLPPEGNASLPPRAHLAARMTPEALAAQDVAVGRAVARFNERFGRRVVTLDAAQVAPLLRGRSAYRP